MARDPQMVLHVMNSAAGGAAMSTLGIMNELKRRGISSAAVCHARGTAEESRRLEDATDGRVLFRPLYWWNKKIRAPRWRRPFIEAKQLARTRLSVGSVSATAKFARKHAVDLVHTNTIVTPEGGLCALALGLPHAWHLRELVGPGHPFRFPQEGRRLGRVLENLSSVIVANAHVTAAQLRTWVRPQSLCVVPNAIALESFLRVPAPSSVSAGPLVVGMVGNPTSRWKNHNLFLDVAERIGSGNVEFRIYGHCPPLGEGDEYTDALRHRVQGMGGRAVFAGFVDDPVEIMRNIDIMLHPTGQESFGRIAVEAMAAGIPVVGIRAGGIGEVVVDGVTGLLAPANDAALLERHVRTLMTDRKLALRLGSAGRERARSEYGLSLLGDRIQAVYRRIMNAPVDLTRATRERRR